MKAKLISLYLQVVYGCVVLLLTLGLLTMEMGRAAEPEDTVALTAATIQMRGIMTRQLATVTALLTAEDGMTVEGLRHAYTVLGRQLRGVHGTIVGQNGGTAEIQRVRDMVGEAGELYAIVFHPLMEQLIDLQARRLSEPRSLAGGTALEDLGIKAGLAGRAVLIRLERADRWAREENARRAQGPRARWLLGVIFLVVAVTMGVCLVQRRGTPLPGAGGLTGDLPA